MTDGQTSALGDVFAERVHHYRKARGWSVRELSEACAAAGAPQLSESSLINLARSSGRRRATLGEWLVLANILDVPPLSLILHVGSATEIELVPGVSSPVERALQWLTAETSERLTGGNPDDVSPWRAIAHMREAITARMKADHAMYTRESGRAGFWSDHPSTDEERAELAAEETFQRSQVEAAERRMEAAARKADGRG